MAPMKQVGTSSVLPSTPNYAAHLFCVFKLRTILFLLEQRLARILQTLKNQVEAAKSTPVISSSGTSYYPDEVWVVNTFTIPEGSRRQVTPFLEEIRRWTGTFIEGNEFESLLQEHCPKLVTEILSLKDTRVAEILNNLSLHKEGRAFGLRFDRRLEDFHVNARALPSGAHTNRLMDGTIEADDCYLIRFLPNTSADILNSTPTGTGFVANDINIPLRSRSKKMQSLKQYSATHDSCYMDFICARSRRYRIRLCPRSHHHRPGNSYVEKNARHNSSFQRSAD